MALGADGTPDLRIQSLDGIRGVDQLANLGRVIKEWDDFVPGPLPARRDRRISFGQIAALGLVQGPFIVCIDRRVDRL